MPVKEHDHAAQLAFKYTPDIPLWVQLPYYAQEGMVAQFVPGLPGVVHKDERIYIDTSAESFDADLLAFFEEYMAVMEGQSSLETSRFALTPKSAPGFFALERQLPNVSSPSMAVKGQVTGPITFCTGLADQDRRAIFYNDTVRDAAVKHLALKAAWQVRRLSQFNLPVIIFIDEPALAGFGSSEFISITKEDIFACLKEVIDAVHNEGGLAGIHVCANTDWSLALDSEVDIVNFDAFGYFDRFVLYPDAIKRFLDRGSILAWGIVPTLKAEEIEAASTESLVKRLHQYFHQLENIGLEKKAILAQSLITPSCGVGSLSFELAIKVMELTCEVSKTLRAEIQS
jgi:methionine synthase II (cobalamin-independent)